MTAFSEASNAIRTRFASLWNTTPIAWQNVSYFPTVGTPFVFLEILHSTSEQITLGAAGSRLFREFGIIYANIFTPVNEGTKRALEYADSISAIFRGVEFSGVLCKTAMVRDGGISEDGNWHITRVATEFQYDKTF